MINNIDTMIHVHLKALTSGQRIRGKCINDDYIVIMHKLTKYTNKLFIYVIFAFKKTKTLTLTLLFY